MFYFVGCMIYALIYFPLYHKYINCALHSLTHMSLLFLLEFLVLIEASFNFIIVSELFLTDPESLQSSIDVIYQPY